MELRRECVHEKWVFGNIIGRVETIVRTGQAEYSVSIAQPWITSDPGPAQCLNVLFGNSSLQADIVLQDIRLPSGGQELFAGPQFGLAGIRRLADEAKRPLSCTALKPMGLDPAGMARLAGEFASGGIDFVKDDHGLADHSFCPFTDRVRACQDAVEDANVKTGGRTVYVPNLCVLRVLHTIGG